MRTNVKNYTDKNIWNRVFKFGGRYPEKGKLFFVTIQSNENGVNIFDDKLYNYLGRGRDKMPKFIGVTSITTQAGKSGLLGSFFKYNRKGVFVWKTNETYENCFVGGYHKGRMKAFRLNTEVYYYRDNDLDLFAEEQGKLYKGNKFTHVHSVSYNPFHWFIKKYINGWSLGCLVLNDTKWYYKKLIEPFWREGRLVDFAILKEW